MDREIYKWNDGVKDRLSDPMVLVRRYYEALDSMGLDYGSIRCRLAVWSAVDKSNESTQARKDTLDGLTANGELARVAFHVFDAKPLDDEGNGWTEQEAIDRLGAFMEYQTCVEKKRELSQTSAPSSEPVGSP